MPERHPTARESVHRRRRRALLAATWIVAIVLTAAYLVHRYTVGPSQEVSGYYILGLVGVAACYVVRSYMISRDFWNAWDEDHPDPDAELAANQYRHTIPYPPAEHALPRWTPAYAPAPEDGVDLTHLNLVRRMGEGRLRAVAQEDIPAGATMEQDPSTGMMRVYRPGGTQ